MVMKRVQITSAPIDFEEELEHASILLEEVQDEAVVVSEWAWAVDARLRTFSSGSQLVASAVLSKPDHSMRYKRPDPFWQ